MPIEILKRLRPPVVLVAAIMLIGTVGYKLLAGSQHSLLDCFYMTTITILTIGYYEVIDSSHDPSIRVFTIFLAFTGVGLATYFLSTATGIIVEGHIKDTYKKRRRKKIISKMNNHYIVCGAGRVGSVIIEELHETGRSFVVIDDKEPALKALEEKYPKIVFVSGDAGLEEVLLQAEIKSAAGIFASTGDDNSNLVISLTAKDINPKIRVVARCLDAANQNKMKKAGADYVITENYIAGMRLVSDMVSPTAATFLDRMFADKDKNLRVEEITVHPKHAGKKIVELELGNFPNTLVIAVVSGDKWTYNPNNEHVVSEDSKIVVITNPEERLKLNTHLYGE